MNSPAPEEILIVDDEVLFVKAACKLLNRAGLPSRGCHSLAEANAELTQMSPALVLLDVRLPDGSGLELLEKLGGMEQVPPVIVLTAFGDIEDAVQAMKMGAADYLQKPCDMERIIQLARTLIADGRSTAVPATGKSPPTESSPQQLIGESPVMRELQTKLQNIKTLSARSGLPPPTVLLTGETGVGKGVVAQQLHLASRRTNGPFVQVDCAALPRELIESELFGHVKGAFTGAHREKQGLIEQADGGVLFLDEIGELPLDLQAKLLAVLDRRHARRVGSNREYPIDAWFIAATHCDLQQRCAEGRFRQDLLYRLGTMTIRIPSLAERSVDIPLLARHYLQRNLQRYGLTTEFSEAAIERLQRHTWPGNIRELIGAVERAVFACEGGLIDPVHLELEEALPANADTTLDDADKLQQAEIDMVRRTLEETGGNISAAARRLGMTRMMLRYRIRKFGLTAKSGA